VYEATTIDGARALRRFWTVTFPVLLPPLSVAIVLRTIDAFKVFDIIYIMTRGGPADSTKTASFFVYEESFSYLEAGSGAAYALIVVAISMVLIALYLTAIRRQEKA
jgi:multiple sugar transport system permease protein